MRLYIMQDNVSKHCSPIFYAPNADTAEREFCAILQNCPHALTSYDLYEVGEINMDNCAIIATDRNHICNGAALIAQVELRASLEEKAASIENKLAGKNPAATINMEADINADKGDD